MGSFHVRTRNTPFLILVSVLTGGMTVCLIGSESPGKESQWETIESPESEVSEVPTVCLTYKEIRTGSGHREFTKPETCAMEGKKINK